MSDQQSETVRQVGQDGTLIRALGTWGLTAAIVNVTIGAGIFRLPASVATTLGAAAPAAYLVCALAMGLIVLCFAEAGSRVSMTGGPYAYVEVAFGPFVGFLSGTLLWAGITAALAAVTSFFADSLAALVPALAPSGVKVVVMLVVLAALALLNVRGVRDASRFNAVMTVAKVLPLAIVVVIGAFAIQSANLSWHEVPSVARVGRASTVLIFAFLGVEAALVPSGEVKDPARTVPRAVLLSIGIVAVLYVSVQIVSQGVLGASLAVSKTPVADAGGAALGEWGRTLILVGSTVSMFGYVSGMTLAVPRMLFAFARDGFLPRAVASIHPTFRTPYWAIGLQTVIVAVLAATGTFERLAIVANGSVLLVYAACCLATVELRRRDVRAGGVPFRVPGAALFPWLALVVIISLLATLQLGEWVGVLAVLVAAAPVYVVTRSRRGAPAAAAVGD
ncbi:MAG TPA: amino acid permease [Gemmatimonadaceae bacterium]|nr:amino acid permease [Gemmatimonadaceae bacterium]